MSSVIAAGRISAILHRLATREDVVEALRIACAEYGCSFRDHSSARAMTMRRRTDAVEMPEKRRTDAVETAAPLVISSSSKKSAARKKPTKPQVSLQPTEDEQRVIRALNSERLRYIKSDPGFECDSAAVKLMRPWIERYAVAALLLVIEWWMTRRATKDFRPLKYLRPKTLFGDGFPTYLADATAWKSDGTHVEYDADALWRETMARGET